MQDSVLIIIISIWFPLFNELWLHKHYCFCLWISFLDHSLFEKLYLYFFWSQEKNVSEIILKAMGRAINKTVLLAEILKVTHDVELSFSSLFYILFSPLMTFYCFLMQRKEEGLYQDISISSVDITDTWEPLEEGLLP